ncbi:hypothetical protein PO909_011467, partial [Leuciscus waleckii]
IILVNLQGIHLHQIYKNPIRTVTHTDSLVSEDPKQTSADLVHRNTRQYFLSILFCTIHYQRNSSLQNENSVIIYSPSSCFKPV